MSSQPAMTVREYLAMTRGQSSTTVQTVNGMLEALDGEIPNFISEVSSPVLPLGIASNDEYFQEKYKGKIEHPAYTDSEGEKHKAWTEYVPA